MKKNHFFLLFFVVYIQSFGQTCSDAESDLNYAYSHVKSAYDSNNLTHLQYYSKRSFDAFERAKEKLTNCNCSDAYDYAYEGHKLLSKLPDSKSFEDGRFYVKRAREIAQKAINELDICSKLTNEDEALAELEYERQKLEEQQKQLKQKEAEIRQMLAEKEQKELRIKKEKLISLNEKAIAANISSYNDMLSACDCNSKVTNTNFRNEDLFSKSLGQIKAHYLNTVKRITTNYLTTLNNCKI